MTGRADSGKTTPLYVICSPFRGVGKTLVARLLTEFHVIGDRPVAAFDLADEGPQLIDFLPDLTTAYDISNTLGQIALFDRMIADRDRAKIIDLSHRTFNNFFSIAQKIGFFEEARRRCIEPLILFIVDVDPKSSAAYGMLRRSLVDASLLPVRNKTEAQELLDGRSPPPTSITALKVPLFHYSLRMEVERRYFSFADFWRAEATDFSDELEEELLDWIEHVFCQFQELERFIGCEEISTRGTASGSRCPPRAPRRQRQRSYGDAAAINRLPIDVPEEVLKFVPKRV